MDLIEEIRATQNHYMSTHAARKIKHVFAGYLNEKASAMAVASDYEQGAKDSILLLAYELSVDV